MITISTVLTISSLIFLQIDKSPIQNGTNHSEKVLSHFWVYRSKKDRSYLVVTTDMFFFPFETKTGDRKGAFGVIRGDLGTFWSDFRMQNHNVLCYRRFVRLVNV